MHYEKMSSDEKDNMVNGNEFEQLLNKHKRNLPQLSKTTDIPTTPKRRRHEENENYLSDKDEDDFQTVIKKNRKITTICNVDNRTDSSSTLTGQQGHNEIENRNNKRDMIFVNYKIQNREKNNGHLRNLINDVDAQQQELGKISYKALQRAVNIDLPPLKIICKPPIINHNEGAKLIKELVNKIKINFLKINKYYERPIGFDSWSIDKQGAMICYTNEIELFVYLWNVVNFPTKVLDTEIIPVPPIHLPPQHSIICKFVPNTITYEEVVDALSEVCLSKFYATEMKGSITNKSRHMRINISEKNEVSKILNSGIFPIGGYLIEVHEFLPPPKIIVCNRCNSPGHIKKECKLTYDKCRRCGTDKSKGDHLQCQIKCHHCNGDHIATDYQCTVITNYRKELINELRRRPELLPKNTLLFVPSELRNNGKKTVGNSSFIQQQQQQLLPFKYTNQKNQWPPLTQVQTLTNILNQNNMKIIDEVNSKIDTLMVDYEKLKTSLNNKEMEIANKYNNHKLK